MRRRQLLAGGAAASCLRFGGAAAWGFGLGGGGALASGPDGGEAADEGVVPRADWYGAASLARWGGWGPPARILPPPAGLGDAPDEVAGRVLRAARRHVGLGYQHHHLPDFDPPEGWPWRRVSAGRDGPGLDCSNFTSLAFNQALGIKLPTAILTQAGALSVPGPGGRGTATLERIVPGSYDDAVATLRPADLLYIRSDAGRISHVVLWLGEVRGLPSFVDCTDAVRRDAEGRAIPTGVEVRPFLPDSWYGRRFAHAHRLVALGSGRGPAPAFADGGDL